ncbi:hypothetical protein vseg_011863 [Gypsophila vaccaria]
MSKDKLFTMGDLKRAKGKQIDRETSNFVFGFSISSSIEEEVRTANDRISKLPDEILSMILAPLPLQEAARTSVLSKRWRHVWSSSLKLDLTLRT